MARLNAQRAFWEANRIHATRRGRTQDWYVGAIVNVGFMRGLTVTGRSSDGTWSLQNTATGRVYAFSQGSGLTLMEVL